VYKNRLVQQIDRLFAAVVASLGVRIEIDVERVPELPAGTAIFAISRSRSSSTEKHIRASSADMTLASPRFAPCDAKSGLAAFFVIVLSSTASLINPVTCR
jgi:hypothetical protein